MEDLIQLFVGLLVIGGIVVFLRWLLAKPEPKVPLPTEIEPPLAMAPPARPAPSTTGHAAPPSLDPEPRRRAMQLAVQHQWLVDITYVDEAGAVTERTIEPRYANAENTKAFCRLRQEERRFRYDRMIRVRVHAKTEQARQRWSIG